jgi:protein-S-isoprenylcysteine O-methyltransferase Ste14
MAFWGGRGDATLPLVTQPDDEAVDPPNDENPGEGAEVRVPPPLVFAGAIALAFILGWIWPRDPWVGGALRWIVAMVSIGGGVAFVATALGLFRQTDQDPKPWLPTREMVTEGPYKITRNPMYLGLVLITVGIGYVVGNGWFAITGVLAALVVQKLAIEPEEAYLERKFGDDYRAYKRSVRRWV